MRSNAFWLCLAAAALFGAATPASKALLGEFGPFTLAGFLYLGAALGVVPLAVRDGLRLPMPKRNNRYRLAGVVVFGGLIGPVLLLMGLQRTSAASAALWLNLELAATAVLAALLFSEQLGRRTWLAVGTVTAGGVLLVYPFETGEIVGALLIGAACIAWGLDNNLTALLDEVTPAQSTFFKGITAGSINLGLGFALEDGGAASLSLAAGALGVGVVSYGLSLLFYVAAAQRLGATRSQLIFSTAPFIGVALAWAGLGEQVRWLQLGAGATMAMGMGLLMLDTHEHTHTHAEFEHTHSHRHDDAHHNHAHPGLAESTRHTHPHRHARVVHSHPHLPDLHHRHQHRR